MRIECLPNRRTALAITALTVAGGFSCNARSQSASTAGQAGPTPAGIHAVHSDRVQALMRDLSRASLARLPQEIDTDAERRRRARLVAEAAGNMADAAAQIPQVMGDLDMNSTQRDQFAALAGQLRTQAIDLESLAKGERILEMEAKLYEISTTCTTCHSTFRLAPTTAGIELDR